MIALGASWSTLQARGTVQMWMHRARDVTCQGAAAGEREAESKAVFSSRSQFHCQAQKSSGCSLNNTPKYTKLSSKPLDNLTRVWCLKDFEPGKTKNFPSSVKSNFWTAEKAAPILTKSGNCCEHENCQFSRYAKGFVPIQTPNFAWQLMEEYKC